MFQEKVVEKIKTHILCSVTNFRKSYLLWDKVEKYCRAGQATHDNMAHAHFMLDNCHCKHTLRMCSTFCFSTAKLVTRTRLNVTLYAIRYTPVLFKLQIKVWTFVNMRVWNQPPNDGRFRWKPVNLIQWIANLCDYCYTVLRWLWLALILYITQLQNALRKSLNLHESYVHCIGSSILTVRHSRAFRFVALVRSKGLFWSRDVVPLGLPR